MLKRLNIKTKKGFTLIEMLVAMAIFAITISLALGVFTTILKSQRKVLAQQQVLGEMSYALEYMSRALRMAQKDMSGSCVAPKTNYQVIGSSIKFLNYKDECQEFLLDGNQLRVAINLDQAIALTSPNINITKFNINLSGKDQPPDDFRQPAVTFLLEITNSDQTKTLFQTTVSQRNLDVQY